MSMLCYADGTCGYFSDDTIDYKSICLKFFYHINVH